MRHGCSSSSTSTARRSGGERQPFIETLNAVPSQLPPDESTITAMNTAALDWLRCPFCGTRLNLADGPATVRQGDEIIAGVLGCQCCAFPIVDGIPTLIADDT